MQITHVNADASSQNDITVLRVPFPTRKLTNYVSPSIQWIEAFIKCERYRIPLFLYLIIEKSFIHSNVIIYSLLYFAKMFKTCV